MIMWAKRNCKCDLRCTRQTVQLLAMDVPKTVSVEIPSSQIYAEKKYSEKGSKPVPPLHPSFALLTIPVDIPVHLHKNEV